MPKHPSNTEEKVIRGSLDYIMNLLFLLRFTIKSLNSTIICKIRLLGLYELTDKNTEKVKTANQGSGWISEAKNSKENTKCNIEKELYQ